uniref:Transposase (Putative), gypsy type n=1 Tax=Tanacetum cinerariifolium TaxID=118510 RepID=A0A6L2NT63_TANCI|nr:hypothetical protein [Tanacetum cinerariifolium]
MSFSKRPGTDVVCYTKPLDSLKGWNDHFFWVHTFACHALFSWLTGKSVSRDAVPKSSEFNAQHYDTLVAYPASFHKYPKPFFCLIGMSRNYSLDENTYPQFLRNDNEEMDLLSFIRIADPTKVRIGERERDEDEPKLLDTIVGRVVPLLPVSPDRYSGELEASVDKLFDEGGSGEQADQGDFASGGHGVGVQLVNVIAEAVVEDVAPAKSQRKKKQKTKVVDAGEPSHPAKKLRGNYEVSGEPTVSGKSHSAVQRSLVGAVQHAEVRGRVMPTLPFVSSSVSTTPECEGVDHAEFLAGANLRTLEAPQRFFIFSDSSDHSGANIAEAEVDSICRTSVPIMTSATTATPTADPAATANKRLIGSLVFVGDSSSAGGSHPISGGFSDRTGSDFLVDGIRTVVDPDSNLQRVYVPQWNVTNVFCMDDGVSAVRCSSDFFECGVKEAEATEAVCLRDETQTLKERNIHLEKEKNELEVKVTDLAASVKVREQEVADLDVVVTSVKLQNDSLADQVHELEASSVGLQEKVTVYENCVSQLEKFQDEKMEEVNEKFDKLCVNFVDMALHLEENSIRTS